MPRSLFVFRLLLYNSILPMRDIILLRERNTSHTVLQNSKNPELLQKKQIAAAEFLRRQSVNLLSRYFTLEEISTFSPLIPFATSPATAFAPVSVKCVWSVEPLPVEIM